MPKPDVSSALETEHLTVNWSRYNTLVSEAVREVTYCLFVNGIPSSLTLSEIRDSIRTFVANCEAWVDSLQVIVHKEDVPAGRSDRLRVEYQRLLRGLRKSMKEELFWYEEQIWKDVRKRLIRESKYAIFQVTESKIQLQRIEINLDYEQDRPERHSRRARHLE